MIQNILLETAPASGGSSYTILFIGIAFIVLMMVMTILPQRKRQKQAKQMMETLTVGTKVKTIGGMIGNVVEVKPDGSLIVNVGTEESATYISIDKLGIYQNLDAIALQQQQMAEAKANKGKKPTNTVNNDDTAAEERKIDD